ncbi:AAA family ATPase [Glaciimonas sp. Gout2]|uniref:AAA family ATPase n=1 Tax=unclassified Glaciimonas TaxID=2644401 RepID=UPI002B22AD68|nr:MULTISPECIES: AAA family ATPase [unclassified Glaciimonas]MEB0012852.1 AAA family ATPase [Glaciimonas sp. Cout2]MEB0080857.1 AAA family ATPase [Glaciimonas sp. Gout2]
MLAAKPYLRALKIDPVKEIDFDAYPFCIPAVRELEKLDFHADVTFLVGENGAGKSTLLEAMAVAWGFNAEGGNQNTGFSTANAHSDLHTYLRTVKSFKRPKTGYFLRAESFFNVASNIEELDAEPGLGGLIGPSYGVRSLHKQSHGEAFLALLQNKFRPNGFYMLDEPESALSPNRQLAALAIIHRLAQANCQFIIATHSPILLAYPNARIYLLDQSGLTETRYEDTEHYTTTRHFLNNPAGMLEQLFAEENEDD